MPGKKTANIKRPKQYEALVKKGLPKTFAAKIANTTTKPKR